MRVINERDQQTRKRNLPYIDDDDTAAREKPAINHSVHFVYFLRQIAVVSIRVITIVHVIFSL